MMVEIYEPISWNAIWIALSAFFGLHILPNWWFSDEKRARINI